MRENCKNQPKLKDVDLFKEELGWPWKFEKKFPTTTITTKISPQQWHRNPSNKRSEFTSASAVRHGGRRGVGWGDNLLRSAGMAVRERKGEKRYRRRPAEREREREMCYC